MNSVGEENGMAIAEKYQTINDIKFGYISNKIRAVLSVKCFENNSDIDILRVDLDARTKLRVSIDRGQFGWNNMAFTI